MKYRLLVLDIDGTLTNNAKKITHSTREAIIEAQRNGVRIVLASGRPTYGIIPLARELLMDRFGGYILAFNGGKIIEAHSMQTIYASTFPCEVVARLHSLACESKLQLITYHDEHILTEDPDNQFIKHELFLTKMKPLKVDNITEAVDFDPDKCLIVGEGEKLIPLAERINCCFEGEVEAYRSEPFFLEVVPPSIDKARSLAKLAQHTGIALDEMIAVGDGFNDISMIRAAGLGIAMDNAQDEVKECADYVTQSNENDGVAHVIETFLL